jgi:hypothetical protein
LGRKGRKIEKEKERERERDGSLLPSDIRYLLLQF